jgi:hypothetical protein
MNFLAKLTLRRLRGNRRRRALDHPISVINTLAAD